jgi:hypothetical protein
MRMDEAQLATLTAGLPEMFANRLPEAELEGLRSMAAGGEWDELLDLLVAVLQQTRTVVSPGERDRLREALVGWGLPTGPLEELTVRG